MREYSFRSKMNGLMHYTEDYPNSAYRLEGHYILLYVYEGCSPAEVDGIRLTLSAGALLALSKMQRLQLRNEDASDNFRYACLVFDANFYCIFANDHEVSCRGVLFGGTSIITHIKPDDKERECILRILEELKLEFRSYDRYQEEALRSLLKYYLITASRAIQHSEHSLQTSEEEQEFIRQFVNLVDEHYLRYKQVKDYADLMHVSSKTLNSRVVASGRGTPLKIIHERIYAEAVRRLLYNPDWSIKEIAIHLGFDEMASFSRFFKRMSGRSVSTYRREQKG